MGLSQSLGSLSRSFHNARTGAALCDAVLLLVELQREANKKVEAALHPSKQRRRETHFLSFVK